MKFKPGPGFVYLVEFENGIKFGITQDKSKRMLYYRHPWCRDVIDYKILSCDRPLEAEDELKAYYHSSITTKSTEFIVGVMFKSVKLKTTKIVNDLNKLGVP